MKKQVKILSLILLIFAFMVHCNESSAPTASPPPANSSENPLPDNIDPIDTSNKSILLDDFMFSSFSRFVLYPIDGSYSKILILFGFFPYQADLCQQATYSDSNPNGCQIDNTYSIPCQFQLTPDNDLLNIDLNDLPPGEADLAPCANDIILHLKDVTYTVEGLLFNFNGTFSLFTNDFGFHLTQSAVIDSLTGKTLNVDPEKANLENIVELLAQDDT
jgi:hypothetical protein